MTDSNTDGLSPDGRFVLVPKPDHPRIENNHWARHGKEPEGKVRELDMKAGPRKIK